MSSINQIVSQIAHSIQQPNNIPVRRALRLSIIHAYNELVRKTYTNNNVTDKVLQQRFMCELIDVPDGDLFGTENLHLHIIKRSKNKPIKPIRFSNGLPFNSVRTIGFKTSIEIPFVKEASSRFYNELDGMCNTISYDYINGYIYLDITKNSKFVNIQNIIIEGVFEKPHLIPIQNSDNNENIKVPDYDDEFIIPEDMVGNIKKLVLETFNVEVARETNEITDNNLVK